jgi:2-oxoglutarate dehydrogenase E1 component
LAKEVKPRQKVPSFGGGWRGLGKAPAHPADWTSKTQISKEQVAKIADSYRKIPADFTVHPKLKRMVVDSRIQMFEGKKPLDFGAGEMLAFGSLLLEGTPVRFTGQDVERGTFSHRHAVLHDYENGNRYTPLQHVDPKQPTFTIMNSMLSEFAVLGFEWGYASADPRNLVIWEAQFGDFVNGAQPIVDQILAAAESKWRYMNGIVMNLPHGYEGQGPEHSNAYLERFLSLCAENNMQVCVPTTSAQYFHMLRRQIHRKFRKPLVLMTPKSLLRAEQATSPLSEFLEGTTQLVIDDPQVQDRERVRRVLLCTGKVYYTLAAARAKANKTDTAIIRVEQLYPFPQKELTTILAKYPRKEEVCWVQEEPKNRGAWTFMEPRLLNLLPDNVILAYHGRDESASPAVGSKKNHDKEEEELIAHALELSPKAKPVKEATAPGTPASAKTETAVSD